MSQLPLDFDVPLARDADPVASKRAVEAVRPKLVGLRLEAYRRAEQLCERYGDATASEIGRLNEAAEDLSRCESLRKRVRELVVAGWLEEAGERICRKSGSKVMAFKVKQ